MPSQEFHRLQPLINFQERNMLRIQGCIQYLDGIHSLDLPKIYRINGEKKKPTLHGGILGI